MGGVEDILWLGIGGLPHMDLAALGELGRRWPDPRVALRHLTRGGDDLRGIVPPARRESVAVEATRLASDERCEALRADLAACGGRIVRTSDEPFGRRLPAEAGWPPAVSVRGELPGSPCVAVVGMRKASPGGRRFASRLAADLARESLCIVSGLAFGIDKAAHEGALSVGGATLAVLAGGVARPSPVSNQNVAEAILETGGALVSHVPAASMAPGWRFPIRNRLIAGLASAVVVVEAAARGGSLSTAAHAVRLGCPLLAVPGPPWSEHSVGTNALLADGALMCRGAEDVLVALGLERINPAPQLRRESEQTAGLSDVEVVVLDAVPYTPEPVDGVARATSLPLVTVLAALGRLEERCLVEAPTPTTVMRAAP